MKLYLAGNGVGHYLLQKNKIALDLRNSIRHKLISFAYRHNHAFFEQWIELSKSKHINLFIDSGAFSEFTTGIKINNLDLIRFLSYNCWNFDNIIYAPLDCIGDPIQTKINTDIMKRSGLSPIDVFHVGSDFKMLTDILKSGSQYIALGGLVSCNNRHKIKIFIHKAFEIIKNYWPIKVHALGIIAPWCLEHYPFYSADSTSAVIASGLGKYYVWRNNKFFVENIYRGEINPSLRHLFSIEAQNKYEDYLTSLWASRGIVWDS